MNRRNGYAYKTNCRLAYLRRGRLKAVRFYRLSGINVVGVILNKMRTLHGPIPSRKEGVMVFSYFQVNLMMTSHRQIIVMRMLITILKFNQTNFENHNF